MSVALADFVCGNACPAKVRQLFGPPDVKSDLMWAPLPVDAPARGEKPSKPPSTSGCVPRVVTCGGIPDWAREVADEFCERRDDKDEAPRSVNHLSAAFFARWLCNELPPDSGSQNVLVSAWRAAKPCAQAIEALVSGDYTKLRPDARRTAPSEGAECVPQASPFKGMIIPMDSLHFARAKSWATKSQTAPFKIIVVQDQAGLSRALASLLANSGGAPKRCLAASGASPALSLKAPPGLGGEVPVMRRSDSAAWAPLASYAVDAARATEEHLNLQRAEAREGENRQEAFGHLGWEVDLFEYPWAKLEGRNIILSF